MPILFHPMPTKTVASAFLFKDLLRCISVDMSNVLNLSLTMNLNDEPSLGNQLDAYKTINYTHTEQFFTKLARRHKIGQVVAAMRSSTPKDGVYLNNSNKFGKGFCKVLCQNRFIHNIQRWRI